MNIKNIINGYLGNTQVNRIFRGIKLVWFKDIPIVSLEITGETEVAEGNTLQLGISYNPSNTTQRGVVWSSSDETKATVDSNGLVNSIGVGNVTITATSTSNGSITDTHNIIIDDAINLFAYGVKQDLSGDGQTLIRVGNLELHKTLPIQSKMRGCLLNDNGIVNYYLSNDSDLLKEDGITPSILNGIHGNVMTEIPSFYVLEKDEGGFAYRYISEVQLPGFRYIPKQYISRYEAVINRNTGKLMSIINNSTTYRGGDNTSSWDGTGKSLLGRPCTGQSRSEYRTGARMDRSSKWNISTTLSDYTVQLLFITEYATYNSQAAFNSSLTVEGYKQGGLGDGVTNLMSGDWSGFNNYNPFIPCGYTADLGNRTGVKNYTGTLTTQVNRYRGIELPFGHNLKHRDGFVIEMSNNYTIAKYYIFDNPNDFADTKTVNARYLCDMPTTNGYIKRFNKYTNIASTIGGSYGSWSYDYLYVNRNEGGTLRGFLSGGNTDYGTPSGLGCSRVDFPSTRSDVSIGTRLSYCDENIIIETTPKVTELISLTITGVTEVVEGNTLQLGINYNPSNTTQRGVVWSSSDETKATVDSNGLVTGVSAGNVIITATSIINGAISDTYNVTINEVIVEVIPVESITVNGTTPIVIGSPEQFTVTYNPLNTTEVGVVWTSSNQNVVTVNSSGVVTAIGDGTATITATSIHRQDVAGTQVVTVTSQVIAISGLTITGDIEVDEGNTLQLGIDYTPSNTTQTEVVWSSSDETKATVDSNGLVTAIGVGNVIITATSISNETISDTYSLEITSATINSHAYGIKQDLSGDGQTLIRVGNLELHKTLPIQSQMRGCLLNDDGTVNYYLSNDSDLLKEDGVTPSILDGTDGNVMTEIPAFYVLEEDIDGFAYTYISETQLPGFKYIPKQYIGRYEAAINRNTGKLMSIINNSTIYRGGNNSSSWDNTYRSLLGKPYTSIYRSTYRTGARMDRSSKWNISTTLSDYTVQLLFIIEYATYNSQATFNSALTVEGYKQGGLGAGVTNINSTSWNSYNTRNPFIPCGYTAEFGNRTGVKDYIMPDEYGTLTTQVNRYRGIELPFGHIYKHRDGCVIELSGSYTIAKYYIFDNPDNYADTKTVNAIYLCDMPSVNGYIKRFNKYTNIASTIGGSEGSWGYDYIYIKNNGAGTIRGFLSGGSADLGSRAGLGCSYVNYSPTNALVTIGARLTYCSENIIIQTN